MPRDQATRVSKFLARHLRHAPEDLGLEPAAPPGRLFHGTHPGALEAIRAQVHLRVFARGAKPAAVAT